MPVTGETSTEARVPLRDQVRDALQARIADGRLRPGDRLFEQDIAAEFGISRVPVREAIRMLQSEGFVEVMPRRRGVFVRGLDRHQAEELFEVREALEVFAARLAAQRGETAGVRRMAELADQARKAHEAGDIETMSTANAAFHDQLVTLAGNDLLASILEPLHGRLAWMFRLNMEPERVCGEHEELHAAIAAGDAERAADVAKRHVHSSRKMVLERILF
ncbi:GntR family transcriptional regulator [Saccharopolyspora erythraea NRRL 2338]|uniref:GntR family transcriptional regulator n=1 Tax=Saccharopolyspora erythraea TaxID=1836 RepID=A0ABN1DZ62_SACER|nr:GntR family transcriptional regulator [Saccharopolyspora erythraea]EQD82485.1 GntR family transcriptional regulator [Saccharopolyspora erythraea D]PFG96391.1 GntR family transcriptional regulator [Saccharopolyspora erythraea NRRL 2338]QRK92896.1 GntR family transcriptional regulator [Saccharopolyspora erythraea]